MNTITSLEQPAATHWEPIDKAVAIEDKAARSLDHARTERERLQKNKRLWNARITEIDEFQKRLARAADEIAAGRAEIAASKARIPQQLGIEPGRYTLPAWRAAITCAEAQRAVPLMEAAEKTLIEEFRALITQTREFGLELAIPTEALASLPSVAPPSVRPGTCAAAGISAAAAETNAEPQPIE